MTSTLHWLDGPMAVPKITDRAKVVRMDPRTKSLTRACSRRSVMDRSASQQDVTHVLGRHRTRSNCTPDCNLLARQAPLPSGPVMAPGGRGVRTVATASVRSNRVPGLYMAAAGNCCRLAFAFQAGHIPSRAGPCERLARSPIDADSRWSLMLLSPLLSARVRRLARSRWQAG